VRVEPADRDVFSSEDGSADLEGGCEHDGSPEAVHFVVACCCPCLLFELDDFSGFEDGWVHARVF
jgi:hypothetical protein